MLNDSIRISALAGTILCGLCLATCSTPVAAQSDSIQKTTASSPAPDDNLNKVLTNWTTLGNRVQTLSCKFVRQEFDTQQRVETRGHGVIHYELDGHAVYAVQPADPKTNTRSSRADARGTPLQLTFAKSETFYWVAGQLARINPDQMEYELFEVPEDYRSTGVVEAVESFDMVWTRLGCLERQVPGLIEVDADELRQRYDWSLESLTERQIVLKAVPRDAAEKRHCSMLVVYLDPKTYATQGTKLFDATGATEILHTFSEMKVNATRPSDLPSWAPNIGGMLLLTPPPLAPPADE